MLIRVILVEDEDKAANQISKYLADFGLEVHEEFSIVRYTNAVDFLEAYKGTDIVFMDIRMPGMDGMEAARRLRQKDSDAILIFTTNFTQYAVKGYEVDALDYIVKPINYYHFAMKMDKALRVYRKHKPYSLPILCNGVMRVIDIRNITYIESNNHDLIFHVGQQEYKARGSMAQIDNQLQNRGFSRCHVSYLVNLAYVTEVKENTVVVDNTELRITRAKKKIFLSDLSAYLGG